MKPLPCCAELMECEVQIIMGKPCSPERLLRKHRASPRGFPCVSRRGVRFTCTIYSLRRSAHLWTSVLWKPSRFHLPAPGYWGQLLAGAMAVVVQWRLRALAGLAAAAVACALVFALFWRVAGRQPSRNQLILQASPSSLPAFPEHQQDPSSLDPIDTALALGPQGTSPPLRSPDPTPTSPQTPDTKHPCTS